MQILGCDAGSTEPNFQCPLHKPENTAKKQTNKLPLAVRSLPPEVGLCASSIPGAGYGVCAKRAIPIGAWIGPYEGKFVKPEELLYVADTSYMWEVFTNEISGKFPVVTNIGRRELFINSCSSLRVATINRRIELHCNECFN